MILLCIIVGKTVCGTPSVAMEALTINQDLEFSLKQLTRGFNPLADSPLGSSVGFLVFNLEIR